MAIDKISKMSIKGVKLKSESFFPISPDVLELWRKNIRGMDIHPPVQIGLSICRGYDFGIFKILLFLDRYFGVFDSDLRASPPYV